MKVLITGGAGFIGSHFIKYYMDKYKKHKVVNMDKLTYAGNLENVKSLENNPNYYFLKEDICNINKIDHVKNNINNVDLLVNFAAETHVDRSIKDKVPFLKTNIWGTYELLEFCRKSKNEIKFVQISTDEVYGEALHPEGSKETDETKPKSPYAASKLAADRLAFSYWTTYGLPIIITRSSNNYGPRQYPEKLIPFFLKNILQGKSCPIYGDGENKRDWIHVMDNCSGILTAIDTPDGGEVYNIGGNMEKTNNEIIEEFKKYFDVVSTIGVEDRLGHVKRHGLDITKIERYGWRPQTDFEDGFKETIKWYRNNKRWLGI